MEVLQELQHQWESGCEKDPTRLLGQSTRLKSIISTMTAREKIHVQGFKQSSAPICLGCVVRNTSWMWIDSPKKLKSDFQKTEVYLLV